MTINKILSAESIKDVLCAIDEFCQEQLARENDETCLRLKEEILESDKDILCILGSYLCVCEDGEEIIDALYEFSGNCKGFIEADEETTTQITKEEFEAVLDECEEKCEIKDCVEFVHKLNVAEVNAVNRYAQHLVRMKPDTINVFLPCVHNIIDKTRCISDILGRVLFFVVNKHVNKNEIRNIMDQMIPECKDSKRGTMDLFIEYFYEVVKYKDRKPGIYTKFDSHMKQVIVVEFYKRLIKIYKQAVYEADFVSENVYEWSCKKRLPDGKRKCEKCKFVDSCFSESSSSFEEKFIEDMALSSGYPSAEVFWDSMLS